MHDTKWWYVIPIEPHSKLMYNTFTNMKHMEDVAGCNEDDIKHANEDVVLDDQEIRDPHDNEDEHAISHDHKDDPAIDHDGDVDEDDQGLVPLSMDIISIVE